MKHRLPRGACLAALLAVFSPATASRTDARPDGEWVQLFNGKDLAGWTPKIRGHAAGENFGNTFRVEDGVLKVGYEAYDEFRERFGHLFYEKEFSSYRLRVEYRFVGEQARGGPSWAIRNSGIMIHGQSPASMAKDQDFPVSIEVQLLGGGGTGERTTANLCTPGTNVVMDGELVTRHCTNSTSKTYHGDQWVTAEVEVRGDRITHFVEGDPVFTYTDPQLDERDANAKKLLAAGKEKMLRGGTISLQSESHPVEFRTVEILLLDGAEGDDEADADDDAGWVDLLAAKDLSEHWTTKGNWQRGDDGVVTLTPRPGESGWSRFDAYLWLEGTCKDFAIEFDYKVAEGGNSGFYFHVGDRANPVATGIEVQIYESHRDGKERKLTDHDSGGIIPGIPPLRNAAKPAGEWNRFQVTCKDGAVTVKLNGVLVNALDLDHPSIKDRPPEGAIGFQDHALPLSLRNIRIRKR